MRRNPYLFKPEEYQFLHKIFLNSLDRSKFSEKISKKRGVNLGKNEIMHVKKKFQEWKIQNHNELLWME